MTLTLGDLASRTGLDVLAHLEREMTIPVLAGLQAQGDLLVIPLAMLVSQNARAAVTVRADAYWRDVPPAGIDVIRATAGGNPHTLVADPGTCAWTTAVQDWTGLALGALETSAAAYLVHPEHGGSGIAPGCYVIRRQREKSGRPSRLPSFIAD